MVAIVIIAVGVLVGVTLANSANPQPLPPQTEQDCGCGVPGAPPRGGPR